MVNLQKTGVKKIWRRALERGIYTVKWLKMGVKHSKVSRAFDCGGNFKKKNLLIYHFVIYNFTKINYYNI